MHPGSGITPEEIGDLVDQFYAKVRRDAQIGPIFNEAIEDWPAHLALLKNFWLSVLLGAGMYRGNPLSTHLKLPLEPAHFQRWLTLFEETAGEVMPPAHAQIVVQKSHMIARNFQAAIAMYRGEASPETKS